jgi:hypothetical protein
MKYNNLEIALNEFFITLAIRQTNFVAYLANLPDMKK